MLKINQRAKCPAYYKSPTKQNNQTVVLDRFSSVWVVGRKGGRISPPGRPIGRHEILVVLINAQPQDWEQASPKTFIYNTIGGNKRFFKLIITLIVLAGASEALRENNEKQNKYHEDERDGKRPRLPSHNHVSSETVHLMVDQRQT